MSNQDMCGAPMALPSIDCARVGTRALSTVTYDRQLKSDAGTAIVVWSYNEKSEDEALKSSLHQPLGSARVGYECRIVTMVGELRSRDEGE